MNISKYTKQLTVAAGLLALPFAVLTEKQVPAKPVQAKPVAAKSVPTKPRLAPEPRVDGRTIRLRSFLGRLQCPVSDLAQEFVSVADENRLDWRLLPSISVIESGGGKAYRNNNILGWNNGDKFFPSVGSGIRTVAYKLGRSPLYRNRDSRGKLLVYNPDPEYAQKVVHVMNEISPVVNLDQVHRSLQRGTRQMAYNRAPANNR
ncbi:MAG TPA: hypothetical protein VH325_06635 [Bryobacteraceae bacterium]|nr:hypothetical protein [Bryobacteraceae bacterium]